MSISIRWLAHAAFQIKTENKTIYIDPRYMKKFAKDVGFFFEKPDKADIILFTHHHADHCYPSSITKMRTSDTVFIGPERCSERIGKRLKIIKAGEEMQIDGVHIKAVDAYNIKRRRASGNLWHPQGLGVGFLIKLEGKTIYHAGDTECIAEMKQFGPVDVALLPIGGKFTMSIDEAIQAAKIIKPKIVIPMHNHESDPKIFKKKLELCSDIQVMALERGDLYKMN